MAVFKQGNAWVSNQIDLSLRHFAKELHSAKFRDELRTSWSTAVLYRLPGIGLAWSCAHLGVAPLVISISALVLALMMPGIAFFLPITLAPLCLMLAGMVFQILDSADGTLARGLGQASKRGGDLDFLIDMAQWGLLYVAIGILADRLLGGGFGWTALGATAAWGRLFARVIRDQLDDGLQKTPAPMRPKDYPVALVEGLSGLIPFLALSGQWIGIAVIALLIYALVDILDAAGPLARS